MARSMRFPSGRNFASIALTCSLWLVPSAYLALAAQPAGATSLRSCGTSQDGSLLGNGPHYEWEVSGPFYISMTQTTARHIARRVPTAEFGFRFKAKEVPCIAAQMIAEQASQAWLQWSGNSGRVVVRWRGYSVGPSFGVFSCTGVGQEDRGAVETCSHSADRYAGHIIARFTIHAYSE
jgi:hypothetical protein